MGVHQDGMAGNYQIKTRLHPMASSKEISCWWSMKTRHISWNIPLWIIIMRIEYLLISNLPWNIALNQITKTYPNSIVGHIPLYLSISHDIPILLAIFPPKKMVSKLNIRHQQKFHQWLYHSILLFIPSKSGQFPSYPNLIIDLPSCYTTYWWKIHYKWRF